MMRWVGLLATLLVGLFVGNQLAYAVCAATDIQCFKVAGTQRYKVDSSGNVTAGGDVTTTDDLFVTDDATVTGDLAVTATTTLTGAVTQSTTTLTGAIGLYSRTLAQMNALTPTTTGQLIFVSDALQSRVCVSSGVLTGAWVVASASSTFTLATMPHCQ